MTNNSDAIAIFCSHLCSSSSVKPLEPNEWGKLATLLYSKDLEPKDLLEFSKSDFLEKLRVDDIVADRYMRLLERSGSIRFEISKYENMGIFLTTRAESNYPKILKQKLGNGCPPIFYYAGNIDLLNRSYVGFVGSRTIDEDDADFARNAVQKTLKKCIGL